VSGSFSSNVMLVAFAYCTLVTLLGIGWDVRWLWCERAG